jgi:hypothetical protein
MSVLIIMDVTGNRYDVLGRHGICGMTAEPSDLALTTIMKRQSTHSSAQEGGAREWRKWYCVARSMDPTRRLGDATAFQSAMPPSMDRSGPGHESARC